MENPSSPGEGEHEVNTVPKRVAHALAVIHCNWISNLTNMFIFSYYWNEPNDPFFLSARAVVVCKMLVRSHWSRLTFPLEVGGHVFIHMCCAAFHCSFYNLLINQSHFSPPGSFRPQLSSTDSQLISSLAV